MLIEKLRKQEGFTQVEMTLASFILNYGEELAYISIHELSDLTFTSTATIRRLCQKTGCEGFRDFKVQFLREISGTDDNRGQVDVNRPFHFGAQPSLISANIGRVCEKAIRDCMESLDYKALNNAADLIRRSDMILCYGLGDSGITAHAFINRLIKLRKPAILATADGEEIVHALLATKKTCALFISYRGGGQRLETAARVLIRSGIPIISLSADTESFITSKADVCLKVPSSETVSDNIATFYSQECFSFTLNVLYGILYGREYEQNNSIKKVIDDYNASDTHSGKS